MCDIFGLKCAHDGCEGGLPLHISDYCLPRSVIKQVFCEEHIPDDAKGEYLSDTTYRYIIFKDWDTLKSAGAIEIDWTKFGEVVTKMVNTHDFWGLSHLLGDSAPIALNTSKEWMLTWG